MIITRDSFIQVITFLDFRWGQYFEFTGNLQPIPNYCPVIASTPSIKICKKSWRTESIPPLTLQNIYLNCQLIFELVCVLITAEHTRTSLIFRFQLLTIMFVQKHITVLESFDPCCVWNLTGSVLWFGINQNDTTNLFSTLWNGYNDFIDRLTGNNILIWCVCQSINSQHAYPVFFI